MGILRVGGKALKIVIKFISNMNMQAILVHKAMQNIRIETIEFMLSKRHFVLLYKSSRHGLQDAAERPRISSAYKLRACARCVPLWYFIPNSSLQITKPFLALQD
jgi:hypothetical protein